MRITFLAPVADMSGGARVIHIHASYLHAQGHKVCLVTAPPAAPPLRRRVKSLLRGRGWPKVGGPSHFDGAAYPIRMLKPGRPFAADDVPDADVVIATWWETAEWMRNLPATKGRQAHFVQHYEAFSPATKPRVDAVLRLPTFKITISRWLEEMLRDEFGQAHVALVPNGVDMAQFNAPPRGKQERPTVGMLYATTPWKDVRTGLEAIELLRQRRPDLRFVSFGSTPPAPELPLLPDTTYTVLPELDRIRDIYSSCDVWLCSSIVEGFGLPVLEAMACGCPAVSTRIGGPLDFLEEGVNGFFVDAGDAEAMAVQLDRVLMLPEEKWYLMSTAARETAAQCNWNDASSKFESALVDLLSA